jgi:hypothetical protein
VSRAFSKSVGAVELPISLGLRTGFTIQTANDLDLDGRGAMFFLACAPPKKLRATTFYLTTATDASNAPLEGSKSHRLHVPADVPAKQFWATTVYISVLRTREGSL